MKLYQNSDGAFIFKVTSPTTKELLIIPSQTYFSIDETDEVFTLIFGSTSVSNAAISSLQNEAGVAYTVSTLKAFRNFFVEAPSDWGDITVDKAEFNFPSSAYVVKVINTNEDEAPGLSVQAGRASTDTAFLIRNAADNLDFFRVKGDGLVTVTGFTKLGSTAPSIKLKKLTGTAAAVNQSVSIAHGLTQSKIISYTVQILDTTGVTVKSNRPTGAQLFYDYVNSSNVVVSTGSSGTQIAGQPITILITYEE